MHFFSFGNELIAPIQRNLVIHYYRTPTDKLLEKEQLLAQHQVTAWLGLRNNAVHGHYSAYAEQQVELMLQGVRNFISRLPA